MYGKNDDYMTPFSAWEDVSAYIPRHLTLWEAFNDNGIKHRELLVTSRVTETNTRAFTSRAPC